MSDELIDKEMEFFDYNVEGYWYALIYIMTQDGTYLFDCNDKILVTED